MSPVSLLFKASSESCLTLNGSAPQFSSIDMPGSNGSFQSRTLILSTATTFTCSGYVQNFQVYMEGAVQYDLVIFQVWRPLSNCSYQLRGEQRVENFQVGNDYLLDSGSIVPPLDPVPVELGDIVGVYVNQGQLVDYGIQQYPDDNGTVLQITESPEIFDQQLPERDFFSSDGAQAVLTGAPIVNVRVLEGEVPRVQRKICMANSNGASYA